MKTINLISGKVALVDDADYERVSRHKWYSDKKARTEYAQGKMKGNKTIRMHRLILDVPRGTEVDHINGDGLDNRRSNLRLCSRAENTRNRRKIKGTSSKFKGVYWYKNAKKWSASIMSNDKTIYLGFFTDENLAAKAYDKKAKELFGKFAKLNFES